MCRLLLSPIFTEWFLTVYCGCTSVQAFERSGMSCTIVRTGGMHKWRHAHYFQSILASPAPSPLCPLPRHFVRPLSAVA